MKLNDNLFEYANALQIEFESQTHISSLKEDRVATFHEKAFYQACEFLNKLNVAFIKHPLKSADEEVRYFKEIKPQFLSNIIFHLNCLQIESGKPQANTAFQIKHFNKYIKLIHKYNKEHKDFYHYYKSEATHLDNEYFRRGKKNPKIFIDSYVFNFDEKVSTTHEFKAAKIIAYQKLLIYLNNEIEKVHPSGIIKRSGSKSLNNLIWSDSKVALVELIYALYAAQSLNGGKIEIQELANFFQQSFNIELGDFYRKYLEIKARKYNPTKFLDTLKDALVKKMEEELE